MFVGFDIDDIIVDTYPGIVWTAKFLYDITLPDEPDNFLVLSEILSEDQKERIFSYCLNNLSVCKVNQECIDLIQELIDKKIQDRVVFVTKRPAYLEEETLKFLDQIVPQGISFTLYVCNMEDKVDHVREEGITHYIEDRYKYARQLADNNVTVFMRERPWNSFREQHSNIYKFRNWEYIRHKLCL